MLKGMHIKVGFAIAFEFPEPTPLAMMVYLHPSRDSTVIRPGRLVLSPSAFVSEFTDTFGNRCGRAFVPAGYVSFRNEAVVDDCGLPDLVVPDAPQTPVPQLPDSTIVFLLASRYCEVDSELKDLSWSLFRSIRPGWSRVQAVCDFVHRHIRFDYMQARNTRTALEAYRERVGVCRDFTHLAITLCRCLNIPARYCTGYLGDIGVPASASPMDFSAWFEVFLGDQWYTFDARNNTPRVGRVLMARGRDATDVALTTTFGVSILKKFEITTLQCS